MNDDPAVLTVDEVAGILRISKQAAYVQIREGRFPIAPIRLGRKLRFSRAAVERLVAGYPTERTGE